jgi:hypothetical protein
VSLVAFVAAGATASYLVVPAALVSAILAYALVAHVWGVRIEDAMVTTRPSS